TSDNGPVVDDGYRDEAVKKLGDHRPTGPLRGGKYSAFEGGTRVPFIVRWPGRIQPVESDALVCHVDFLASLATLAGLGFARERGPRSENVLPALLAASRPGRTTRVERGSVLALRKAPWKYPAPGRRPAVAAKTGIARGVPPRQQLYPLGDDLEEQNNL